VFSPVAGQISDNGIAFIHSGRRIYSFGIGMGELVSKDVKRQEVVVQFVGLCGSLHR
jgi:hypothetical protein